MGKRIVFSADGTWVVQRCQNDSSYRPSKVTIANSVPGPGYAIVPTVG